MERKNLSAPSLYSLIRNESIKIPDPRKQRQQTISISDALMSAVAMFSLKFPSMLKFVDACEEENLKNNLINIFNVETVPSDTSMREILDPVKTSYIQKIFKKVFTEVQRGKVLEQFVFDDNAYLMSVDGTGFFSSHGVHCENCCMKKHRDGSITYYHQMLAASIVHPDIKQVIPLAPEPIVKNDGSKKNDCERLACERFLKNFRTEHPHLKVIILEDGLASNGPHIRLLKELKLGYILGCKPGDHKYLFDFFNHSEKLGDVKKLTIEEEKITHKFRWMNRIPLNEGNHDLEVNFLEYTKIEKNKSTQFSWVTHFEINENNVYKIMKGGRARWKIENETFNTLKNLGYEFEHNFGHGNKNLSNNFAVLMMLVFLIDQLQMICSNLFQRAVVKAKYISRFWERMRNFFLMFPFSSWEEFLKVVALEAEISYKFNSS